MLNLFNHYQPMTSSPHRRFAKYVSTRRAKRGLSQQQLADMIGVTKPTISYWEAAKVLPQVTVLEPLARALDGSYEDLFAMVGFAHPEGLPNPEPYMRAKFPGLPKKAIAEADRFFADFEARYGIEEDDGGK
jgi:transcriptional regulator with XRE-family HTH domain